MSSKTKIWAAFISLGLLWGSSFLWIKIALVEFSPFTLVAFRLLIALVLLLGIVIWQKQKINLGFATLSKYTFMALLNTAVPFSLITWSETHIDSGMASILNGTVPLFTVVIAHFWLNDEKITVGKLFGLVIGFFGVVILVGTPHTAHANSWLGQLAVLAAAICYGISTTFARKSLQNENPLVQTTLTLILADIFMIFMAVFFEPQFVMPQLLTSWIAIFWLAIMGTVVAYLLFFYLISKIGSTNTSLVTYIFPVVGVFLGIVFLNEGFHLRLLFGGALIFAGILLVNKLNARRERRLQNQVV